MKLRIALLTASAVLLTSAALAGARPNFSGTWVLDRSRSHSIPPDFQQTLIVTHTGDQLKVETKLSAPQGERSFTEAYTLDSKESEFTPQSLTGPAPGRASASPTGWRTIEG